MRTTPTTPKQLIMHVEVMLRNMVRLHRCKIIVLSFGEDNTKKCITTFFFIVSFEKSSQKLVLRVSSGVPITSKLKALGLRPRAFVCFSVFGIPDETLAHVFDILLENFDSFVLPKINKNKVFGDFPDKKSLSRLWKQDVKKVEK